jgi:hypothetical protein
VSNVIWLCFDMPIGIEYVMEEVPRSSDCYLLSDADGGSLKPVGKEFAIRSNGSSLNIDVESKKKRRK